ncbi:protein kinase family protein [Aequorivita sp. 609]|uniref:protein kinase family protein n=1 Tax=Aequorivita TaxID=153265 RepID=UPI001614D1AE|nr:MULTISPECIES: protein kinase family protein [Aequorivita]MBB6682278.1 protein kinase family protein [Aequorivita sp. 609]
MTISTQGIITAIKNLDLFLKIPELNGAIARINSNGKPFSYVGGFNMVFQLLHNNKKWAFRVWHVPIGENKTRFQLISKYLGEKRLPYFADFIYDEKALLVNGTLVDTIRMEWIEGLLLKEYIDQNLKNKKKLKTFADDFLKMCQTLHENQISHGDLQHGNLMIDKNGDIKLVDYDSICIPDIEGKKELVTGKKGYQHLSRFKTSKASLKSDYFSELVIYLSILALIEKPELWEKYQVKDTEYLLFSESDFKNFEKSTIYKELNQLSNSVKSLVRVLDLYIKELNYLNLKPFENYLSPPVVESFSINKKEALIGSEVEISWSVSNSDEVEITEIGYVSNKGAREIKIKNLSKLTLIAKNAFGKIEKEILITVFPLPEIKAFISQHRKLEYGKETQLNWEVLNSKKVEIISIGNTESIEQKGELTISPNETTLYKLMATALDGKTTFEKELTVEVFKLVKINSFQSNLNFVVESLPITLSWEVENASKLTLTSNYQSDIDVTGKTDLKLKPKRNTVLFLKASNDLFTAQERLEIEVQALPSMPRIQNIIPNSKELIPTFDLDFQNISNSILSKSELDFEKTMKPNNGFSLKSSISKIFKTNRKIGI